MRAKWDQTGEKLYETGVDQGMIYSVSDGAYTMGYPWNGLTNVSENPSGAEATALYADNRKYLNLISEEDFAASVEAFMYPDKFGECIGEKQLATGVTVTQQKRESFGFSYRTKIGNDVDGSDYGYKIHLVYGCLATPTEKSHDTVNENPDAMTMSWDFSTTPVEVGPGFKPTAHISIDSTKATASELTALENILYGTDSVDSTPGTDPRLPLPQELMTIFSSSLIVAG